MLRTGRRISEAHRHDAVTPTEEPRQSDGLRLAGVCRRISELDCAPAVARVAGSVERAAAGSEAVTAIDEDDRAEELRMGDQLPDPAAVDRLVEPRSRPRLRRDQQIAVPRVEEVEVAAAARGGAAGGDRPLPGAAAVGRPVDLHVAERRAAGWDDTADHIGRADPAVCPVDELDLRDARDRVADRAHVRWHARPPAPAAA